MLFRSRVLPRVGGKVVMDKDAKGVFPMFPIDALKPGGKLVSPGAGAATGGGR